MAFTTEQQNQVLAGFQQAIMPARLSQDRTALARSMGAIDARLAELKLPIGTVAEAIDSLVIALKAMLFEPRNGITWEIPPKALKREEPQERAMSIQEADEALRKRNALDEAKREKAKKDEATLKAIDQAIAKFHPTTPRGTLALDVKEKAEQQWKNYAADQRAKGAKPEAILARINEAIAKFYSDEESRRSRM